jgi:hypothetical protein
VTAATFDQVGFTDGPRPVEPSISVATLEIRGGPATVADSSFYDLTGGGVIARGDTTLERVALVDTGSYGALADGIGVVLTLQDVVVTGRAQDQSRSAGINASFGGHVSARRIAIVDAPQFGVEIEEMSSGDLEDVLVHATRPRLRDDRQGMAVRVNEQSMVTLRRAELTSSRCAGVRVSFSSSLDLEDIAIRHTRGELSTGEGGFGIRADVQTSLTGRRISIDDSAYAGVVVDSLSQAQLEDLTVRDTQSRDGTRAGGHGIHATLGSSTEVTRAVVERNTEAGISIDGTESSVTLTDVVVRDTASNDTSGAFGGGVSVSAGSLTATALTVERNRYVGLYVGEGGAAEVEGLALSDVEPQRCAEDTCSEAPFGIGLGAFNRGRLEVERFFSRNASLCGVMVGPEADLWLRHGLVAGSPIGACVQATSFDLGQLTDDVAYDDNGRNLDSTALPVPEAVPTIVD